MKKRGGLLVFVILSVIFLVSTAFGLFFEDKTQSDFDQGTYSNTTYTASGVVLSGNNLTGTFTSRVFDATSLARWENFTFNSSLPFLDILLTVDAQSDVWESPNNGSNLSVIRDDYNKGDGNGATDLEKNSTHLFLLFNQKLWISGDKGLTWSKINDDYNGAEGQNGDVLGIDSGNYIYIIEGDQDVWKSTNGGVSFTKLVSNFNAGNGVVAGLVINSTGAIYAVDVNADVWVSLNQGVNWNLV